MSRSTLWRVLAVAMPALAALAAPLPSVDLTFLLRAGSEILASRAVPTVDAWTFTAAGTPWLDQQWGSEVMLRLVFDAAGWSGLVLFRAALVGLAFGLLLATVRLRAPRLGSIAATLLVIAAFIVAANALALRAQLFAIVLFAATLWLLALRADRPRAVWLIPILALLWANLHGTFPFASALCGLAWVADLADAGGGVARSAAGAGFGAALGPRGSSRHRMLVIGLVAMAATLVNPYGAAVWGYVASLTSNSTIAGRVSEWQPPSPLTIAGGLVWLSVLGVAALAAARVRAGWLARDSAVAPRRGTFRSTARIPWPALLTLALFGGFALASGRGTAWWPFAAVFVIAPWLAPGGPAAAAAPQPRPTPPLLRRLNVAIVTAFVLAGVALLPTWRPIGAAGVPLGTLTAAPQGIARYLAPSSICLQSGTPGPRIWNPQIWGSWLEFAAPCALYAVDSRIELFSGQTWDDASIVERGGPGWEAIVDRAGVTEVIVARANDEAFAEAAHGAQAAWSRVFADCDGSIWARLGPPGSSDAARQDVPLPACD